MSGKIDKYEYLTGEDILPSDQRRNIGQAKSTFVQSNGVIANFLGHSALFNFNKKVTCETGDDRRKYVKILYH